MVVGSRKILGATWYFTRRNPIYSPSNNTSSTTYTVMRRRRDVQGKVVIFRVTR